MGNLHRGDDMAGELTAEEIYALARLKWGDEVYKNVPPDVAVQEIQARLDAGDTVDWEKGIWKLPPRENKYK